MTIKSSPVSSVVPRIDPRDREHYAYEYTDDERDYISLLMNRFLECYTIRRDSIDLLNGRKLEDFWADSERDYTVTLDEIEDPNDPAKQYQSTISRDKSNVYISHIASALLYPDVIAQNQEQGIDRVWGRVGSSLLYWAHRNDGWPNENGQQKAERIAHATVVKGTAFTLDIVTKDGLESEVIPIEELFFTTFWQPNLQKHPIIFRAKLNVTYEEAEATFGNLDNFKYVEEGSDWVDGLLGGNNELKESYEGIIQEDKLSILYVWKRASHAELEDLKKRKKVPKSTTRACFYNILINGVLMYPVDNLSPYKHGYYPISKCIFEMFRSDFLYGNSAPNKMWEDKRWRDDWKTLMRFKGKLAALPPQLIIGGNIDDQIILPAAQTAVPEGIEIKPVEGVANGITSSDIQLMQMADSEIDRASVNPSTAGQRPSKAQTARAEVIQAEASQRMLEPFSRQYAYFMQSRSFHILMSLLQLMSRKRIKRVAVPDQVLSDGLQGTFEILFENLSSLDTLARVQKGIDLVSEGKKSRERGTPTEKAFVSPSQIKELKFFLFSDATAGLRDKSIVHQQEFAADLKEIFLERPDLVSAQEALREYIRMKGYNERILATPEGQSPGAPAGGVPTGAPEGEEGGPDAGAPLQQTLKGTKSGRISRSTGGDMFANAASETTAGEGLPSMPR